MSHTIQTQGHGNNTKSVYPHMASFNNVEQGRKKCGFVFHIMVVIYLSQC